MDDKYGNNKAEIRRLKQRLLILAPDEVKAGKQITINGIDATFDNIVKIFDDAMSDKIECNFDDGKQFYVRIPLVFYDGKRKYNQFLEVETDETSQNVKTWKFSGGWKPLTDTIKFALIISEIRGSGNKAVIYSILKDLLPKKPKQAQEEENNIKTINGENVTIVYNKEIMRLQILFDGIPAPETRKLLKSNGFKWAPSQGAWQRLLNDNANYALSRILDK